MDPSHPRVRSSRRTGLAYVGRLRAEQEHGDELNHKENLK